MQVGLGRMGFSPCGCEVIGDEEADASLNHLGVLSIEEEGGDEGNQHKGRKEVGRDHDEPISRSSRKSALSSLVPGDCQSSHLVESHPREQGVSQFMFKGGEIAP